MIRLNTSFSTYFVFKFISLVVPFKVFLQEHMITAPCFTCNKIIKIVSLLMHLKHALILSIMLIIIILAYLYCAAYTRMSMNESSPPCEQRRMTFNDDGQRVQLARPELTAPHYIWIHSLLPTTPLSPSRHYYLRLIADTNLPTPKEWIA